MNHNNVVAAYVARGAHLLDLVVPNWWERVTKEVTTHDVNQCVLGQVFSDQRGRHHNGFSAGCEYLSLNSEVDEKKSAIYHGFNIEPGATTFSELDEEWEKAISARRRRAEGLTDEYTNGFEAGRAAGRAEGIIFLQTSIVKVADAATDAGIHLTTAQVMQLTSNLIDLGADFSG